MEHQRMCRACLKINVKMYSIDLPSLFTAYSNLTGYKIIDVYRYICFECAGLLMKCYAFKLKCHQAQEIIANAVVPISENTLNNFRKLLFSPLEITSKVIIVDIEPTETTEVKPDIISNILTEEIKEEIKDESINKLNFDDGESIDNIDNYNDDALLYNDSSNGKDQIPKRKKKKKTSNINYKSKSTILFDDADDEPLSKISKNEKGEIIKSTSKEATLSKAHKIDLSLIEEFITVVELSPEDAKSELELRKESSNYRDCSFKCSFCYRGFEAQKAFDNHIKKHSAVNAYVECAICHLRFKNNRMMANHYTSCHTRKYSCKVCPYSCFSAYQAKSHVNRHKGINYTCDQCGEIFRMPNTLFMHKYKKHPTECVCALCGSAFATKRGLQGHTALAHRQEVNEEKGPTCEECNVIFSTETAWKRHLVQSAKHTTSNGCDTCGETFPDAESLKKHSRTHSRKQRSRDLKLPAACPLCKDWMTDREAYKKHMTSSHPDSDETKRIQAKESRPVVCEVCGKRFAKPCFMRYHQRKHTGERAYACTGCSKTFVYQSTLAAHHRAVHTEAATAAHQCGLCPKRFVYRSALNKHVRTSHLKVRPHKCDVCGKCFPTPCEVKYHAQYVHCKVPWPKRDRSKKPKATDD